MKISISVVLFLAGVLQALAAPSDVSSERKINCGTTKDAVFSDCEELLNSNFSVNFGKGHTCSYHANPQDLWRTRAYKPVCSPGNNCCIYTLSKHLSADNVRKYGKELLLRCRDKEEDKVNGRIQVPGGAVCLSNGDGCGDCFDD